MNVGELMVTLALNITDFDRKLQDAEAKGLTFTETLKTLFASADPNVDIRVHDGVADAKIAAFKADLDTIPDEKVTRLRVDRSSAGGMGGGGGIGPLATTLIASIPAIAPIGAAATMAVMGLASAFTSATVGALGFGAVAIPNLKDIFSAASNLSKAQQAYNAAVTDKQKQAALLQEKQAVAGLDSEQQKALASLQSFEDFWHKFTKSFESPVLNLFSTGLKGLQTLLTDLKPAIAASATAFGILMKQFNDGMNGTQAKAFFTFLAQSAIPDIVSLGDAFGNIFGGIMNLMVAFGPTGQSVAASLSKMTENFRAWTASLKGTKGFEDFLKYAAASGRAVLDLIGNLAHLIGTLLKNMAPLGLVMVQTVSSLAKWINQLMTTNPLIKTLVALVFGAVTNIVQFVGVVIQMFTWLGKAHPVIMDIVTAIGLATAAFFAFNAVMALNPITLVIIAIGLLVAAGVEVVKHWTQVKQFFVGLWTWFTTETSKVWNGITQFFHKWGVDLLAVFVPVIGLPILIAQHWQQIQKFAHQIWNGLVSFVQGVWNGFTSWMNNSAQAFVNVIVNAFKWMYNHNYYFKDLVDFIRKMWQTVQQDATNIWNAITNFFGNVWNGIKKVADAFWTAEVTGWEKIWKAVVKAVDTIFTPIEKFFEGVWNAISGTARSMWNSIKSTMSGLWSGIVSDAEKIFNGLGDFFKGLWTQAEQWGSNIVHSIAQGIENAIGAVRSAVSHVASAIGNFLGFHSPSKEGPGRTADQWMPNLMNMLVEGVQAGSPKLRTALSHAIVSPMGADSLNLRGGMFGNVGKAGVPAVVLHIHGDVYGMDDFGAKVKSALTGKLSSMLHDELRQPARQM